MEDDLKNKTKNGRRPQKKNGRRLQKKKMKKNNDDLNKIEDDLNKIKNGRRPQKKWKTTSTIFLLN